MLMSYSFSMRSTPRRSGSSKRTHAIPASTHWRRIVLIGSAMVLLLPGAGGAYGRSAVVQCRTVCLCAGVPYDRAELPACQSAWPQPRFVEVFSLLLTHVLLLGLWPPSG